MKSNLSHDTEIQYTNIMLYLYIFVYHMSRISPKVIKQSLLDDVQYHLSSDKTNRNMWKHLVKCIDKIDKNNPYNSITEENNFVMWKEQIGINFPLLYVASVVLYRHFIEKKCDTILFASRDCCHWVDIFKKMFPNVNSHYFHCSRIMFQSATDTPNPEFTKYISSLINKNVNSVTDISDAVDPQKILFVDIHGTGKRVFSYFEKQYGNVPYCFLLSATLKNYKLFPPVSYKYYQENKLVNLVFDARGSPIEMLNYDTIGTLKDYTSNGPQRDPLEYSLKYLEAYHTCIKTITKILKPIENIDKNFNDEQAVILLQKLYRIIQDNKPTISVYIKHPGKHDNKDDSLTMVQ
jgi:hypothetical protein